MASHRKPRQRPPLGGTARTAATLALAGAATAGTALEGSAHAEPLTSTARVKAQVERYHREAEEATERFNGAKENADRAAAAYEALRDRAARETARLNTARNALGSYATAQYRSGAVDPGVQLALSSTPDDYLDRASATARVHGRQASAVGRLVRQIRGLKQVRSEAKGKLAELNRSRDALALHKRAVESKLHAADRLLDRLTAEQRRRVLDGDAARGAPGRAASGGGEATGRPGPVPPAQAPSGRAALAVSFAYGALGKPYVWGATGPSGYDCSGLTQAAWRSAGVALPRTSYTQINAGRRVGRAELAPGDLVFFYDGLSHVGLYIGGGKMIHAPRPGSTVRIAGIDDMPFAGASRPL
ncbi:NlpC/P60 family protein [Streptomyces sp. NPDC018031]|uniref:C40 family peptidase n=1 Tax=Streptomyces sp. NPDC018031 TaxID=3365033 RepID=UPI0037A4C071